MRELSSVSLLELNRKNDLGVRGEAEGILMDTVLLKVYIRLKKWKSLKETLGSLLKRLQRDTCHI